MALGEQANPLSGFKAALDDDGPACDQRGKCVEVQPGGVELRQHVERRISSREIDRQVQFR